MYKLYLTPRSPFARRVRLAFKRLPLPFEEVFVDIFNPPETYLRKQPAGTVPILEINNNEIVPDSSLILDFLNEVTGGKIWGFELLQEKTASVWCVSVMTNAVAYFLESQKKVPDKDTLTEAQENIERLFLKCSQINQDIWIKQNALTQAGWDLAVALDYAEFRIPLITSKVSEINRVLRKAEENEFFIASKPKAN